MSKGDDRATIFFIVTMGLAVALGIALDISEPLCRAAKLREAAPDKIVFGCFEFWFNRYQSLLGSVLTAGVAGITLRFIGKQLRTADRQAAVAAAQNLRLKAAELVEERGIVDEIDHVMEDIFNALMRAARGPQSDIAQCFDAVISFEMHVATVKAKFDKYSSRPVLGVQSKARDAVRHKIWWMASTLAYMRNIMLESRARLPGLSPAEKKAFWDWPTMVRDAAANYRMKERFDYFDATKAEIDAVWAQIEEFETIAVSR